MTALTDAVTKEAIDRGEKGLKSARGQEALEAAHRVAATGLPFTTDDVWAELKWPALEHDEASFMGSVMRHLSQADHIERTGARVKSVRPEQHNKMLQQWKVAA